MPRKLKPPPEPEAELVEPLLYDVAAVARLLGGVSKNLVYKYVQEGKLRAVKLGTRTMFTRQELERFVSQLGE